MSSADVLHLDGFEAFKHEYARVPLNEKHEFNHRAGRFVLDVGHQANGDLYRFDVLHDQGPDDPVKERVIYDLYTHAASASLIVERITSKEVLRQVGRNGLLMTTQYEMSGAVPATQHDVATFSGIFESFIQAKQD